MASINFSCSSTSLARARLFGVSHINTKYANAVGSFKQPCVRLRLSINPGGKKTSIAHSLGSNEALISDVSGGVEIQPDSVVFGSLAADMAPTSGFPVGNDEFDLDLSSEGFSRIAEAVEDIQNGKMVIVVDDEDRENEGDLRTS